MATASRLGEIQAALRAVDGVEQAVVIAREDRPGDKRLVGYVTGTADPGQCAYRTCPDTSALYGAHRRRGHRGVAADGQRQARQKALPAPQYQHTDEHRAPTTPTEEILAGIYAQILGLNHVSVDASFFELGGDSLQAMRLVAALNRTLDAALEERVVFDAPTVAQLALRIGGEERREQPLAGRQTAGGDAVVLRSEPVVVHRPIAGPSPVYNLAAGLRLEGSLDVDALGAAFADVLERHESLRTLFPTVDGTPQQLILPADQTGFIWDVVDAAGWPESRVQDAIEEAARHRFRPGYRDPLSAMIFRVADDEHVLVVLVHHIAADVVVDRDRWGPIWAGPTPAGAQGMPPTGSLWRSSMRTTRCGSVRCSAISTTPTAASPGNWHSGPTTWRACLSAWRCPPTVRTLWWLINVVAGLMWSGRPTCSSGVARLARDTRCDQIRGGPSGAAGLAVEAELQFTMWQVGFPIAGRRDPTLDELVGFFVNTLVLRVDLAGDPSVTEVLAQVRADSLSAFEHQDVPFEVLVERLNPTRSLTHHPLVRDHAGLAERSRTGRHG